MFFILSEADTAEFRPRYNKSAFYLQQKIFEIPTALCKIKELNFHLHRPSAIIGALYDISLEFSLYLSARNRIVEIRLFEEHVT